ncbi:MAG: type II 3-dehydroquinate dehydratase [Clostridia bacterium]|nr:type II 3-dehydroquinate dehydratase [Clostridia bacterium]
MYGKIMLINGPNLNMLGVRPPEIYGTDTLADIEKMVIDEGKTLGFEVECFQSNSEGALIDCIHSCFKRVDAIILNAGAYTHYSYAIRDAIETVMLPVAEVHLSDIHKREEFRHTSVIEDVCAFQICGHGKAGYIEALHKLKDEFIK